MKKITIEDVLNTPMFTPILNHTTAIIGITEYGGINKSLIPPIAKTLVRETMLDIASAIYSQEGRQEATIFIDTVNKHL